MRNVKYQFVVAALVTCMACGCASADAEKRVKADTQVEQLPEPVAAAAGNAVEGIEITDAKRRAKRDEAVYKLEGFTREGKEYVLKVTESGKVLTVEAARTTKKKTAKAELAQQNNSPFQLVGSIQHSPIRESSGVVASRRHPGVLWTHNDKGNTPELYAITKEGKLLGRYTLPAVNNDWEDIDIDERGRLYVGKIGNNEARSSNPIEVLRVAEPGVDQPPGARRTLPIERTWRLRYPKKPFDCESLFVHGGHGYVISKHLDDGPAGLYRFDLDGADEQTLTKVTDLPIRQPVTGANLSADGSKLAVLTYGTLYLFDHGGDLAGIGSVKPVATPTPSGKLEGVCFTPEGILLTAESRQIYLLDESRAATVSVDGSAAP
jgi:hypothetical protein